MKRQPPCILLALILLASLPGLAGASDREDTRHTELRTEPRWEAGIGVAPVSFPAYRGSRRQVHYVLPIPYLVYRADRLRVDREGARGLLVDRPRFEIDISIDGAIPVNSSDDGPRAGMDDLDPLVEMGPSLNWMLTADRRWQLRVPIRAAISLDRFSTSQQGWKAHPMLRYTTVEPVGGWNLGFNLGPIFATRDFHAYYYDVTGDDVIPGEREAFSAPGGYSGSALLVSASRRFERIWFGSFLRYDYLGGAQFEDSPLVETKHAVTAGLGISWVFRQSSERVPVRP